MKKMKKILIPIIILLCLAGIGYALWHSLEKNVFSTDQFPQKTTINGVDCSGLSAEKAKEKLTKEWNSRTFSFTKEGADIGSVGISNFTYDIDSSLKTLKKDNFFSAALNHFFKAKFDVTMDMKVKKVSKSFMKELKKADYLKEKNPVKTKNAYVDLSSSDFKIVPEVIGTNIDYDALAKEVAKQVASDSFKLEYIASKFYQQPQITSDSEEIKEYQAFCKEYFTSKVTYTMGSEEVKIPPQTLAKIYNIDISENGEISKAAIKKIRKAMKEVSINEEAVREFVEDFATEYNTLGRTREFTSLSGRKIKVSGGDYGFAISRDKETEQLIKDLKSGKEVKREPVWLMTGFGEYNKQDDIGNTYVDISLAEQHLWYFKDGKEIVSCPVVTGSYQVYDTPTGTFGLSYKQRGATLKGSNADGSSYESPVSYWMPFYGNYGMHDAPWRSSFGGDIFRGGGSHGCVNMPIPSAKKLFENLADKGVPVIVHW